MKRWSRVIRRAFQLVRARRFMKHATIPPQLPGAMVVLPDGVRMQDVIFWFNREHGRGNP